MVVFDKSEEQIVVTLKGHTKKVTSVIFHPSQVTFPVFLVLFIDKNPNLQIDPLKSKYAKYDLYLNPLFVLLLTFFFFFSSRWFSLLLLTPPSVCGLLPGATAYRWCVPTRQVSLVSLCTPLETTCSAPLRIRCACSLNH